MTNWEFEVVPPEQSNLSTQQLWSLGVGPWEYQWLTSEEMSLGLLLIHFAWILTFQVHVFEGVVGGRLCGLIYFHPRLVVLYF